MLSVCFATQLLVAASAKDQNTMQVFSAHNEVILAVFHNEAFVSAFVGYLSEEVIMMYTNIGDGWFLSLFGPVLS